jgi:hypothetical protein
MFHPERMSLIELLQGPSLPIAAVQGRYLLQGQHSQAGRAVAESFANLKSAIIRASELIGAGYTIEIWSPTSLETGLPFIQEPVASNPSISRSAPAAGGGCRHPRPQVWRRQYGSLVKAR